MTEKRFQIITRHGIEWSSWFPTKETPRKWQMQNKLLNEYRNGNT